MTWKIDEVETQQKYAFVPRLHGHAQRSQKGCQAPTLLKMHNTAAQTQRLL